jgi:Membrane domain of glycerophosphoryl diester phosphodiesterase
MTSTSQLRPLTTVDLLDTAFYLYRSHFRIYASITALVLGSMLLVALLSLQRFGNHTIVTLFQTVFVLKFLGGVLTNATAQMYHGQAPTVLDAFNLGLRPYRVLFQALILELLVILVPSLLVVGIFIFSAFLINATQAGLLNPVIGAVVFLPPWFVLSTRFILTNPVIIVEQHASVASLRRSWRLTGVQFWRALGVTTLVTLLVYLIAQLPQLMVYYMLPFELNRDIFPTLLSQTIVRTVLSQIGLTIVFPLQAIVYTLFYYDMRIRREGYDLEVLTQESISSLEHNRGDSKL